MTQKEFRRRVRLDGFTVVEEATDDGAIFHGMSVDWSELLYRNPQGEEVTWGGSSELSIGAYFEGNLVGETRRQFH